MHVLSSFSPYAKRSMHVIKHKLPFLRRLDADRRENLYVSQENTNKQFPLCKFSFSAIFINSCVRQSHLHYYQRESSVGCILSGAHFSWLARTSAYRIRPFNTFCFAPPLLPPTKTPNR